MGLSPARVTYLHLEALAMLGGASPSDARRFAAEGGRRPRGSCRPRAADGPPSP